VFPRVEIDARVSMLSADNLSEMIPPGTVDYVLDCIDHVPTKVALLHHCHTNNIRVQ
jgi:tRNA A37 threonylcarbamoyladenosine dehydratase